MANRIRVNTNRLNNDANKVLAGINKIKAEKQKLESHQTHLDSMWDGEASEAFKTAFWDDLRALETIIKDIESLQKYEVNAKTQYDKCENKISNLISSLKI